MVICLGRGADLHVALLMPLPLTVSCFSNIQIGVTLLPREVISWAMRNGGLTMMPMMPWHGAPR